MTGKQHYYGYFLDPSGEFCDGDEFIPKNANFRLDGFGLIGFCVWNLSLYIFESDDSTGIKSIYTLDLSAVLANSSQMMVFEKSELEKGPDMLGTKHAPNEVATPDGRILVFSHNIFIDHGYYDRIDFEVYDPMTKLWSKLPQLCCSSSVIDDDGVLLIYGSGFLNESMFFLTSSIGTYAFDFNKYCWQEHTLECIFNSEFAHNFLLVGNEFYLTCNDIRRPGDGRILTMHPPPPSFPDCVYDCEYSDCSTEISSAVALLDFVADEEFSICLAQTAVDGNDHSYLTFDICRSDLAKYRVDQLQQGDSAELCSTTVHSFRFIACMEQLCKLRALGMFPIGEATN